MTAVHQQTLGIRGIAYDFDETSPIDGITQLRTNPRLLTTFKAAGHARYAKSRLSLTQQAIESARLTLDRSGLSAKDIDAVFIGTSEIPYWKRYPEMVSTEILKGLGISHVPVVGITLAGCANYTSSLRMARNMIRAEGLRNVLVIETNQVRGEMKRLVLISKDGAGAIFADGAASFILTTEEADFDIAGMAQIVEPIDGERASIAEIVANNINGFRHVFENALREAKVEAADIGAVMLGNVNLDAVNGVANIVGLPQSLVFKDNIARIAHVWSADTLINLHDYCDTRPVAQGTLFALLCYAESYFSVIICRKR